MANGTLKVSNIQTSSGSGTITLGQSGETISVPSGATINLSSATQTGVGIDGPSFRAYQSSSQGISNATNTQVTLDTEDWDTDNAFASNTFTCPSGKAGKYIVVGCVRADTSWATTNQFNAIIYRNGASNTGGYYSNQVIASKGNSSMSVAIIDLAVGDTLKLYVRHDEGGSESLQSGQESTYFCGTRIGT